MRAPSPRPGGQRCAGDFENSESVKGVRANHNDFPFLIFHWSLVIENHNAPVAGLTKASAPTLK